MILEDGIIPFRYLIILKLKCARNLYIVSFQFLFVLFTIYASVIVMNLLVSLMVNHMNMDEAESLRQTHRVDQISDKIEMATVSKMFQKLFCQKKTDDGVGGDTVTQTMIPTKYPMVKCIIPTYIPFLILMFDYSPIKKLFQMTVRKEQNDENDKKCPGPIDIFIKLFDDRRPIEMDLDHRRQCKMTSMGFKFLSTISKDVVNSTLATLRQKREGHLAMVRTIKKIQSEGTEKMAKFSK